MEKGLEITQRFAERKQINEEKMVACVERFLARSERIGEGENAEVFALNDHEFSNLCAKRMKKRPKMRGNSLEEEADLQKRVHAAGVKTPLMLYALETDEEKIIVMERIFGNTVDEVARRKADAPETFDHKRFFSQLTDRVEKMHEANVYHRDLHSGNVMIDHTGEPVIIDFGASTLDFDEDSAYREPAFRLDDKTGRYVPVTGYYRDDLQQVRNMKTKLRDEGLTK